MPELYTETIRRTKERKDPVRRALHWCGLWLLGIPTIIAIAIASILWVLRVPHIAGCWVVRNYQTGVIKAETRRAI